MKVFLSISLYLAWAQAAGLVPTIEVRPSSSNVSIGEKFKVTVELRGLSGTSYDFPKEISDGSVELILSRESPASSVAVYDAQVFAIGRDARIPQIQVQSL